MLLAASSAGLGCGGGNELTVDGDGAERSEVPSDESEAPPAGTLVAPLRLGELRAPASGSAPDVIELQLSSNLDIVSVRALVTDAAGAALSTCQVAEVYRVGPSAVQWPIGGSLSVPLAYDAALSDGVYVHAVSLGIGAFGNRWLQVTLPQYFEIDAGQFRALTADAYMTRTGNAAPASLPSDACPPLPDYSDEMSADGATSSVDFDSWNALGTIQPLRWVASATRPFVGSLPSILTFHALLPERGRLQLDLMTPADAPADFEAIFPADGRILLDELGPGEATSWQTTSGRASVRVDGQGRAQVELSDIVFAPARGSAGPRTERSVAAGSLAGQVVAEEWP